MERLNQFCEQVINILIWAREQAHITEDALNILVQNINEAKDEINQD